MENEQRNDNPPEGNAPGQPPQYNQPPYKGPQNPYARPPQGYPPQGGGQYPNQPPQGYPPQNYHPQYGSQYAQPTFCGASNLCGVRGWLLFLCISLTIISPLRTVLYLVSSYEDTIEAAQLYPAFGRLCVVDSIATALLAGFSIFAGYRLWAVRPNAVGIAKVFLIIALAYSVVSHVLVFTAVGLPADLIKVMLPPTIGSLLIHIAIGVAWIVYLCISRRVEITYARNPQERGPWQSD